MVWTPDKTLARYRTLDGQAFWNLLIAIVLLVTVIVGASARAEPPTPQELLDRSIVYHDPDGRFLTESHRLVFAESRPNGPDRRTEALIDVAGERFEIVRRGEHTVAGVWAPDTCEMTLDGRSEVTAAEREEHHPTCERLTLLRNYYTYLWGLPMKLRDPGTQLGRVTATTLKGPGSAPALPVYDLRVTYEEEVGGDIWYFYFDRETYALVGYRFYHDEAKNDGEVIYLDGEVAAVGLRLPKARTWYTHEDDKLLGTDTLLEVRK
ncbi:MAG: DUF6503 family protein [Acidobacteriota bacterium]|nr:DUF6503 family protein [Acidobacteriota bacterium]